MTTINARFDEFGVSATGGAFYFIFTRHDMFKLFLGPISIFLEVFFDNLSNGCRLNISMEVKPNRLSVNEPGCKDYPYEHYYYEWQNDCEKVVPKTAEVGCGFR